MNGLAIACVVAFAILGLVLLCIWVDGFRNFIFGSVKFFLWIFYFFLFWWWYATLRKLMKKDYPKAWPFKSNNS
jgi:hypothetical protein